MENTKLKPCPFCGSASLGYGCSYSSFLVRCDSCGAKSSWREGKWQAAEYWNTRATDPVKAALAEALEGYEKIIRNLLGNGDVWDVNDLAYRVVSAEMRAPRLLGEKALAAYKEEQAKC